MARKNFGGGMMPGNMNNLLKQAQKMQKEMEKMQQEMEEKKVTATAGGGAVEVVFTGKRELEAITIDPEVIDPDDVEMLQDLIIAAVNEGLRQVEELTNKQMGKITGGMNLPGGLF
ncbi:MAG: YbaB/EbfC family nucleoid-associated protein [Epulopiscium sp.]|nr:YbaB/EbfC family nucleoid-associated protein [Candidatus Epulonipiscium sp.]